MKMYTFQYDGYGNSFTVMSNTPENALLAVKSYLRGWYDDDDYAEWKDARVDSLPQDYKLIIQDENEVFLSETC